MTEEDDNIVDDAKEDEQPLGERANDALGNANLMHRRMDEFKEWSVDTAIEIRTRAQVAFENGEIEESERDELEHIAQQIRTVYQRLNVNGRN